MGDRLDDGKIDGRKATRGREHLRDQTVSGSAREWVGVGVVCWDSMERRGHKRDRIMEEMWENRHIGIF